MSRAEGNLGITSPAKHMNTMNDYKTAEHLMKKHRLTVADAARLTLEMLEESGGNEAPDAMAHCRRIIRLGTDALRLEKATVPFAQAAAEALASREKQQRAGRTLSDFRYYTQRLMRSVPGLAERPLRAMTPPECAALIERAFSTPSQRHKARVILSGVFCTARKRGWCGENPMRQVEIPVVCEKEILPLTLAEVRRLLATARQPRHAACLPALALMLYAGVRPEEVRRLHWRDIDVEERELVILPRHSKTGGGRHIALCPALLRLLKETRQAERAPICPKNWRSRWRQLRLCAGFRHWVPDVLRHTFASFHVKHFHDLNALQLCMGHRDQRLLLTRYVNLSGLSRSDARLFWGSSPPPIRRGGGTHGQISPDGGDCGL